MMTKWTSTLLFAAAVLAQEPQINTTVLGQLAQNLQQAGFTQLATVAATIANTSVGNYVLSTITNGDSNYTIFAPADSAFKAPNVTLPTDPNDLAVLLSYHVVPGFYGNQSLFDKSPNNTIITTFLNSTDQVHLQGNASQVLSARVDGDHLRINNQKANGVNVTKISTFDRFSVLTIDAILVPPPDLSTAAKNNNLTMFGQVLQQAGITDIIDDAQGITIFAPTDSAIQSALAQLGDNVNNATLIATILQNHVINGTTVYSTQLDEHNYTSSAGQALNFWVYNNTITVYSGSDNAASANITRRDVLAKNGVIHIIDKVLANTNRDDNAASSAYESATKAATDSANSTPTPTDGGGPVGGDNAAAGRFATTLQQWTAVIGSAVVAAALGAVSL